MNHTQELEKNLARLDEIVQEMDTEEISLEDSFRLYREGRTLCNLCRGTIDEVEKQLIEINGSES